MITIKSSLTSILPIRIRVNSPKSKQISKWVFPFHPLSITGSLPRSRICAPLLARTSSASVVAESDFSSEASQGKNEQFEANIEKVIYGCRFFAILAVGGSLLGSVLCFIKGCAYVVTSFQEYFVNRGKVIFSLVEALDVYLLGTVMLVFGMGLYELFISNLDKPLSDEIDPQRSNLFGLFTLKERPAWLNIKSINELKSKLGHVIVMLLLIGFFDKTRKASILSPVDLLCFSASVLLSSGCLFLLSKLHSEE